MKKPFNIYFLFVFAILTTSLMSCERATKETATLVFKFEKQVPLKSSSKVENKISAKGGELHTSAAAFNSSLAPSTIADINCYAVFVAGPESNMSNNYCSDSTTGTVKMRFGPSAGFIPAGTEVSLEVPSGPDRTIYLVGLRAQNGACKSFAGGSSLDSTNLSFPYIIGTKIVALNPGVNQVVINRVLNTAEKFDDCSFSNKGGNLIGFGDGRDGNLTLNGTNIDLSTPPAYGALTWTPSAAPNAITLSTKIFSTAKRIAPMDVTNHTKFNSAASLPNIEFEPGDEILWHVAARNAPGAPDTYACGGGIYGGSWGTARIMAISGTQFDLDSPIGKIGTDFAPIGNFSSMASSSTFCFLQMIRVPNFDLITINGATTITAKQLDLSSVGTPGGILAFRAKKIIANAALMLSADGRGFVATNGITGQGMSGVGVASASNANGGVGGSANANGGGGNVGAGGASSTLSGGSAITYCGSSSVSAPCSIFSGHKIIFGGAGGSNSTLGGNGGGAIFVQAGEITGPVAGTINISAGGASGVGGTYGAGGGAGGSIALVVKNLNISGDLNAYANGGPGASPGGGGGGGGSSEIYICDGMSSISRGIAYLSSHVYSALGFGNGTGANGGVGLTNLVSSPEACNAY